MVVIYNLMYLVYESGYKVSDLLSVSRIYNLSLLILVLRKITLILCIM